MDTLQINLFGRFSIEHRSHGTGGFEGDKVQELLCYLLLHRDRPHPREALASLLWGDQCTTARSKTYLRKTLWQLQSAFGADPEHGEAALLHVEPEWIGIAAAAPVRLDVAVFEAAYAAVRGERGHQLDEPRAAALDHAVGLYRGDLLEGWYQDWCLAERERLQHLFLAMLDKLVDYCEARGLYENGLAYAERILHVDRAREHTHRRLMSLRYLAGDRTGALRQYVACAAVLRDELDVQPSRRTTLLCELIREDQYERVVELNARAYAGPPADAAALPERLERLRHLQETLIGIQTQVQHELEAMLVALLRRHP